jgi:NTP pyrophosphatase (non-canonical NTP hydrolase)
MTGDWSECENCGLKSEFKSLQEIIHRNAVSKKFWERDGAPQDARDPDVAASKIMLIVTELAEAVEAIRGGWTESDHLPGYGGVAEELADTVIRAADLSEALGVDLMDVILAKMKYNLGRPERHGKLI